jgi:hypothetical protein
MFMKKEPVCRYGHDGTHANQKLKDVGANSAEHGHALQEFDPCFLHCSISLLAIVRKGHEARLSTKAYVA